MLTIDLSSPLFSLGYSTWYESQMLHWSGFVSFESGRLGLKHPGKSTSAIYNLALALLLVYQSINDNSRSFFCRYTPCKPKLTKLCAPAYLSETNAVDMSYLHVHRNISIIKPSLGRKNDIEWTYYSLLYFLAVKTMHHLVILIKNAKTD